MTVRIVTDSACDLPQSLVDELGITVVPLTIRFGTEEFVDRKDLTTAEFWARSAASPVLPETAAPPPGLFEESYRALIADGATGIVVISLSGGLSATMQSAELASRSVAGETDIAVVDSNSVTLGLGIIVAACARAAKSGATFAEVSAMALDLSARTKVWGALDTLENLKKGGRIGGAKAMLASVLSIKPIVEVRDGKVEEGGKQRTRSKALAFLVDKMRSYDGVENLAVLQADCRDVEQFVAMVRPYYSGEILVGDIGPVVGSHTGPGTIGLAFQVRQ
ncbi:MAG TPA: DegV family protein [Ilumatobacteraceae bacterium]